MRVYGLTKKAGLLLLFDSCYNVMSNNIDVINHIDRYVDYIHMYDVSDNFLSHPKTLPCNIIHVSESGRKLPTAYTSQQLLRWLRPKRYIFPIFLHTKNSEK